MYGRRPWTGREGEGYGCRGSWFDVSTGWISVCIVFMKSVVGVSKVRETAQHY